jgi:hypothetical protein
MVKRADPSKKFRRLSPSELRAIGASPKSRQYVNASTKKVTRDTSRISMRQYLNKQNQYITGEKISREKVTKKLQSGEIKYKTKQAEIATRYKRDTDFIRKDIPGVAPKDVKLIWHKLSVKWSDMDDDEKEEFEALFKRYPRIQVISALGSPPTK